MSEPKQSLSQWRLSAAQVVKHWRQGMLSLMSYALMLAVACMLLGRWFALSLDEQFVHQSLSLFGAQRAIVSSSTVQLPDELKKLPLKTSRSVVFHTMVYAGDKMQLLRVRATDSAFPLLGSWQHEPNLDLRKGQIWLDPQAMAILAVKPGERVSVGDATLTVAGVSKSEPSTGAHAFWLVPKAVISLADLAALNVIQPGSRVQYIVNYSGTQQALAQLDGQIKQLAPSWQYVKAGQFASRSSNWIEKAQLLMSLSVSLIVLLCFYTMFIALRGYLRMQRRMVVVARTLGASHRRILLILMLPLIYVFVPATLIGCGIAWVGFTLTSSLGASWLHFSVRHAQALGLACLPFIAIVLMLYAAFRQLRQCPYRQILNQKFKWWPLVTIWFVFSVLVMAVLIGNWRWVGSLIIAVMVSILVVRLARRALVIILKKISTHKSWQLAAMQIRRASPATDSLILGLTLAIGLTATLWILQHQLVNRWLSQLPDNSPNYFLVNLQPSSQEQLSAIAQRYHVKLSKPFTMVRGRFSAINAKQLCQQNCSPDEPKAPGRELNLTQSETLPQSNQLIAGHWFKNDAAPSVSVAERFASQMHLSLGDKLTFNIYGDTLTLPISSIRRVNWQSFQPNFFVIFSPGALDGYPGMMISSAYAKNNAIEFLGSVRKIDPGFSAIDIQQILGQTQQLLQQLTLAIRFIALLLVAAALLLLNAQLALALFERRQQVSVWRLLGITRKNLGKALLAEFCLLGLLSSVLALVLSQILTWPLAHLLDLSWQPNIVVMIAILLVGPGLVTLAVSHFIRRLLRVNQWFRWGSFD
ncbi:ABC transporter permease [Celerinatantimonas sp. MCCC 1A17872]|uniref:ABC transporter permease n=1 Tax=Celerinatantimonas sp. MCCC 1A17872 TaxID=3177514 RepID=UPI0038C91BFC